MADEQTLRLRLSRLGKDTTEFLLRATMRLGKDLPTLPPPIRSFLQTPRLGKDLTEFRSRQGVHRDGDPGVDRRYRGAEHGEFDRGDPFDAAVFRHSGGRVDRPASGHPAARARSFDRRRHVVLRRGRDQAAGQQHRYRAWSSSGSSPHSTGALYRRDYRIDRDAAASAAARHHDRRQRHSVRPDLFRLDRRVGAVADDDGEFFTGVFFMCRRRSGC